MPPPKRPKAGGVNKELERAIAEELKEIRRKDAEGKPVYGILERMRVYDRALALEKVKQRIDDPAFGSGFLDED